MRETYVAWLTLPRFEVLHMEAAAVSLAPISISSPEVKQLFGPSPW